MDDTTLAELPLARQISSLKKKGHHTTQTQTQTTLKILVTLRPLPWWKQRRAKVLLLIICVLITVLAASLGGAFSRSTTSTTVTATDIDIIETPSPTTAALTAAPTTAPTTKLVPAQAYTEGWYQIRSNLDQQFCIDGINMVDWRFDEDGQPVFLQRCDYNDGNRWSQQWKLDSMGRLVMRHGSEEYCMQVSEH
eukprot:scaffold899_cov80-Skeletonema_marinoi.AAC.1